MSIGCFFTVLPPFIAEVAAMEIRGMILSIFFAMYVAGSIFVNILSHYCDILVLTIITLSSTIIYAGLTYISSDPPLSKVRILIMTDNQLTHNQ
jgi:hypothetical protein